VTLTYLIRRAASTGSEAVPERDLGALNTLVRQKLCGLLDDRRFLASGGTLAFPCSHLYHQDARFQRKQKPLSRQTVSTLKGLKGRDHDVAAAAMAEGLEVTLYPYMIETCADEWCASQRVSKDTMTIRAFSFIVFDLSGYGFQTARSKVEYCSGKC